MICVIVRLRRWALRRASRLDTDGADEGFFDAVFIVGLETSVMEKIRISRSKLRLHANETA
jgi:hypothetical protein